ncbi:MAG: GIY-YIG nuclease family protein [Candidatus Poribacteria bacterium]|nr:GIY-YIG nuclease family protein [Candidatus Poribacteria bacterium]
MLMFDLLRTMNPNLNPAEAKLHLATWNGVEQPLDVYLAGNFNDWQSWQSKKNFERKFVVSLINLPHQKYKWLFAGVYQSAGVERKWSEEHQMHHYWYELTEHEDYKEMNGRMVVNLSGRSRQSYLYAEKWCDKILLSEIYPERQSIGEFPGFKAVNLTKAQLDLIVQKAPESWRTALSNVAGVYLISDTVTGRFYVGSAYGEGGIWHRWSEYANNGHGGNVELKGLLADKRTKYAENFRYSILEISDLHDSQDNILQRESHWKDILMSRIYGLNAN